MRAVLRDIRFNLAHIKRRPLSRFATVAILAIGIGGAGAIGSFVDAILFRPLPVSSPGALVSIGSIQSDGREASLSLAATTQVSQWRGIQGAAAYTGGLLLASRHGGVVRTATVDAVGRAYFDMLGVSPAVGTFSDFVHDASGRSAVISYDYWQQQMGGSAEAIGSALEIEGTEFRVIGVTPQWFEGITVGESYDIAVPINSLGLVLTGHMGDAVHSAARLVIARLDGATSLSEFRAEARAKWPSMLRGVIPPELSGAARDRFLARLSVVEPLRSGLSFLRRPYGDTSVMFLELSILLLLVIALGLSGIWISEVQNRAIEWSVRTAVGAAPHDLVRLVFSEMLLLCLTGATVGYFLARAGAASFVRLVQDAIGGPVSLHLDGAMRQLGIIGLSSVAVLAVAALGPVITIIRVSIRSGAAKNPTIARRHHNHLRGIVLATEVAVTIIMLFLTIRSVRSVLSEYQAASGFEAHNRVIAQLLPEPARGSGVAGAEYYRELSNRILALPGVTAVAFSFGVPGRARSAKTNVELVGTMHQALATAIVVSPGFLSSLRVPLIEGRECSWEDDPRHDSVAIVSESLARSLSETTDVFGKAVRVGTEGGSESVSQVVGVSANARLRDVRSSDTNAVLICGLQTPGGLNNSSAVIAVTNGVQLSEHSVSAAVTHLGREYVGDYYLLSDELSASTRTDRITSICVVLYTMAASLLLAIALYVGLMHLVFERQAEFAVRLALGASVHSVQWLAFRMVGAAIGIGVIFGLAGLPVAARIVPPPEFGSTNVNVAVACVCLSVILALVAASVYRPAQVLVRLPVPNVLRTL